MATLQARQNAVVTDDGDVIYYEPDSFWYTRDGNIVRFSVFFGLFTLFFLYMVGGYWHAKRRIKKGLVPLAYHRWLLNRSQRAQYDPNYQNPSVYYTPYQPQQFGMAPYGRAPPPVYDPNAPLPPTYQPPAGATKVDPVQSTSRPAASGEGAPDYQAPAGPPPPAAVQPTHTGQSTNPYRL